MAYLFVFIITVILSSVLINGWYAITRGEYRYNPDGTRYWTGKIFNRFQWLLEYGKDEWGVLSGKLYNEHAVNIVRFLTNKDIILSEDDNIVIKKMLNYDVLHIITYCENNGLLPTFVPDGENTKLVLKKRVRKHKLSYYLRDPFGMCMTCMASFYGLLTFFVFMWLYRNMGSEVLNKYGLLAWQVKAVLVIIHCISLAYLNEFMLAVKNKLFK